MPHWGAAVPGPTRLFKILIAMNTLPGANYREAGLNSLRQHFTGHPAGSCLAARSCLAAGSSLAARSCLAAGSYRAAGWLVTHLK
ncbi:MAG: hypothetical protein NTV33_06215 [Coprothermobacterota bacterium]|nr:hypothetical protein [Coprothermobacterota bacterium]